MSTLYDQTGYDSNGHVAVKTGGVSGGDTVTINCANLNAGGNANIEAVGLLLQGDGGMTGHFTAQVSSGGYTATASYDASVLAYPHSQSLYFASTTNAVPCVESVSIKFWPDSDMSNGIMYARTNTSPRPQTEANCAPLGHSDATCSYLDPARSTLALRLDGNTNTFVPPATTTYVYSTSTVAGTSTTIVDFSPMTNRIDNIYFLFIIVAGYVFFHHLTKLMSPRGTPRA